MELRSQTLTSKLLHPQRDFVPTEAQVEVRWDPLTGYAARLVKGASALLSSSTVDLDTFARKTRSNCPFCPELIEQATPKLPVEIYSDGRIRNGRAVLFPNLLTYSQYISFSVYSPDLHYLRLEAMTPELVSDNLATHVEYIKAVMRFDARAVWASINANHMLPSGSSLFHPHIQSSVDPVPSTVQQLLWQVPPDRFQDYLDTEQRVAKRYIGSTGSIEWLASFAPMGFNDVRALLPGICSPSQLTEDRLQELGTGVATILRLYADMGFQSFNMAVYGAPPDSRTYMLNLRLVCRSNLQPHYRSDVTYFERLHWQAMVDTSPEGLALRAKPRFKALNRKTS
jgi:UDPglucose--hexose-1-phosphate uridylyltransferase